MSFISYAQNYEDVMLMRALRHVERGFYVDVGAQDPVNDSVTKAFYDLGWQGINIEPVTYWFDRLVLARRHDINLQLAVSDGPGELHLFEVVDSGLSTTDAEFAARHVSAGHKVRESDVQCATLSEICRAHNVGEIHFLKVDCEGGEAAALRGLDFQHIRPWVLLIEATEPNSQKPAYDEWESLLLDQGYEFVYQDGLNRFYIAVEHSELKAAFSFPPNVFDYFVRASEAELRKGLQVSQANLTELHEISSAARAEGELVALKESFNHLRNENERREEALVQHRTALDEAEKREVAVTALLRAERDQRKGEAQHALIEQELRARHLKELEQVVGMAQAELATAKREIASFLVTQGEFEHACSKNLELQQEVGRLHFEVLARDQEVARLHKLAKTVFESTSWRVTSPLRFVKCGVKSFLRFLLRCVFQIARGPARLFRPFIRSMARWNWVRSTATRVIGQDSPLVQHARMFLLVGVPNPEESKPQAMDTSTKPLSRRASFILEEIYRLKKGRGFDKPSSSGSK